MEAPQEQKNEWWRHRLYDSEGAEELNEVTRIFWQEIKSEIPEVVYLSVVGSTVKGYATPDSDIDAYLVYELRENQDERELKLRIRSFVDDFRSRHDRKMSIFLDNLGRISDPYVNFVYAKDLIKPTLGDGNKYRDVIRNSLKELSDEDLDYWVSNATDAAVYEHSSSKPVERGLVEEGGEKEYQEARKVLIHERIKRLFVDEK